MSKPPHSSSSDAAVKPCLNDNYEANNESFLLGDITRRMREAFQARIEGSNLTLAQARALKLIAKNPGVKQKSLAEALEIQPMTMAKLLDNLEERGLIQRDRDPADRRAHLINLTDTAAPALETIHITISELRKDMLQDLSQPQRDELLQMLTLIRERLQSMNF